ncbi:MAG: hypothetical protein ACYC61_10160 [Isosphaeraceae bacterium]
MPPRRDVALPVIGLALVVGLVFVAAYHPGWEQACAGISLIVTCIVLALATVAAAIPTRPGRRSALGFAIAGWTYFIAARWYTYHQGPLPTVAFLLGANELHGEYLALPPIVRIVHDARTLAFAAMGALIAGLLLRGKAGSPEAGGEPTAVSDAPGWWKRPAAAGTVGLSIIAGATWLGWRFSPETGASVCYLLTWLILGVAALGARSSRGRRRAVWLGAAWTGLVYMLIAFGPVAMPVVLMEAPSHLPTNHLLHAFLSPNGPGPIDPLADGAASDDEDIRRIARALADTRMTLHFPRPTPLNHVLEPIRQAVALAAGLDLRFYEVFDEFTSRERNERPPVTIDRADIPAAEALRLCLEPAGRTYLIRPGYLRIVPDTYRPLAPNEDPALIAGHCTLALLLAAIGAVAGSAYRRRQPASA